MSPDEPSDDAEQQIPAYDAAAVGRVAARIEIRNVELVYAHFEREDDLAVSPDDEPASSDGVETQTFLDREWEVDYDRQVIGFLLKFAIEGQGPSPFMVGAFFRLTYALSAGEPLAQADLEQFASWNAVFNAWPYFREYVSSTANRAGLPRLVLPVMRVPR